MTDAGGAGDDRRTIRGYFHAFAPAPEWDDLVLWPPDVFALANLVLDHTESYRFVVAPPAGRRWPPLPDWNDQVRAAAEAWTDGAGPRGCEPARLVRRCWSTVTRHGSAPLASVRTGEAWDLTAALLTLFAIADEACAKVASRGGRGPTGPFERRAWEMLQTHGSLSRLSPTRVRIVPKTRFSMQGITIRSLSRYLALCYESVDVRWRSSDPEPSVERDTYNVVLAPWPLSVGAEEFRPASPVHLDNMDTEHYGFFELAPAPTLECDLLSSLLGSAVHVGGRVDAVNRSLQRRDGGGRRSRFASGSSTSSTSPRAEGGGRPRHRRHRELDAVDRGRASPHRRAAADALVSPFADTAEAHSIAASARRERRSQYAHALIVFLRMTDGFTARCSARSAPHDSGSYMISRTS